MAEDNLRGGFEERRSTYILAVEALAQAEVKFAEEFLLAKAREGITDKMAEKMATTRWGAHLRRAQALEYVARKELDRDVSETST